MRDLQSDDNRPAFYDSLRQSSRVGYSESEPNAQHSNFVSIVAHLKTATLCVGQVKQRVTMGIVPQLNLPGEMIRAELTINWVGRSG